MPRVADGQYELVLENRQVMTIFFVVVVLCGVFFGLGYIVGKNTVGYTAANEAAGAAADGRQSAPEKPAVVEKKAEAAPQPGTELTFHKALEEKPGAAKLESQPAPAVEKPADTAPAASQARPQVTSTVGFAAAPAPVRAAAASEPIISLQVAALSKKDDAEALLSLLRDKGFPTTMVTSPSDRLYRIQVGPFASARDADEIRQRLEKEGFKAITKK